MSSGGARGRRAAVSFSVVCPDGVRVAFQLDRFEQTGDDRLEVAGRWYGVRGLRFVRPSLTVQTNDGERNLLALLEHKPWAAQEGEAWVAAFPWQGDSPDPGQAELAVAPSVVVALADEGRADGATASPGPGKRTLRERLEESEKRARRLESEVAWLREEREALLADKGAAEDEAATVKAELAEARTAAEEVAGERDAARSERDAAVRERDKAAGERDAAVEERDGVRRASQELERLRGEALAERASLEAKCNAVARAREEAVRERDQARLEREAIAAERDDAIEASRRALAERDAALGRGSGFPAVSAADLARQPHAQAPGRPAQRGPRLPAMGGVDPLARAIAAGALITLLLVVIVLLKVA
jgi:hypothetical protein